MNRKNEIMIRLKTVDDVRRFVEKAASWPFEIDAEAGGSRIDAKSLIGWFSVDLQNPVTLHFEASEEDSAAFTGLISSWIVDTASAV